MSYVHSKLLPLNVNYLKAIDWYRLHYTLKSKQVIDPKNTRLEVLFKNKNYLVVNKPYDLIVYDYKPVYRPTNTLFEMVKDQFPFYFDPRLRGGYHVLHRLDSVTSGCMCIPLNYFSFRIGLEAFIQHKAEKFYLALVYGLVKPQKLESQYVTKTHEENSFLINVPIGEDRDRFKYARCPVASLQGDLNEKCLEPEESSTVAKVLEYGTYKDRECTKVLLKPITGKRHQLRVHMQFVGHNVVGDMCYGLDDFDTYRTMLHAYKLKIRIDTKERMFIKATTKDPFLTEIDSDWRPSQVLTQLEKLRI